MTSEEITERIKLDLKPYENKHGFFDIPMKWPFTRNIDDKAVEKVLSAADPDREADILFYDMLENYFFGVESPPDRVESIVYEYISAETIRLISENKYTLKDFTDKWVNFIVDDSPLRNQIINFKRNNH